MNKHLALIGTLALTLCLGLQAQAARVAVLTFDGREAAARRTQASIVKRLEGIEGLEVVGAKAYAAKASKAGVRAGQLSTPKGVRKGAAAAEVDGVFAAKVFRKNGRLQLRLRYLDANGRAQLDRVYPLAAQNKLDPKALDEVTAFARDRFAPTPPVKTAAVQPAPAPEGAPPPVHAEAAAAEVAVETRSATPEPKAKATHSFAVAPRRPPLIEARLLAGGMRRGFSLEGSTQDAHYDGGFSLATGVVVETSFFGRANRDLDGLGLDFELLRGFLSTRYTATSGESRSIGTPFWHWGGDLRYRRRIDPYSSGGPTIAGRIGYRSSSFGSEELPEVARISHRRLALGVEGRGSVLGDLLTLEASAGFEPLVWASGWRADAHEESWGLGWRVGLAVLGNLGGQGNGLLYGARFDYAWLSDWLGKDGAAERATETWMTLGAFVGYAL